MSGKALFTFKINHRLYIGFSTLVLLLVLAVAATVLQVSGIKNTTDRIVDLRTPTAQASASLISNINASLANLRGWMLTGNPIFKDQRAETWDNIVKIRSSMDVLSKNWTNPANVSKWKEFKAILDEFKLAQGKVEKIAKSGDEQPALKILIDVAAPQAAVMSTKITEMIDMELSAKADVQGNRVQFLGMMADVRGTLGLGLANIRAYLLTGDEKFTKKFNKLWAKNDRRFADLANASYMMSAGQKKAFKAFSRARADFNALPAQMFKIRGSDKWNMANYTLVSEAAPRAAKLLVILGGEKQEDGMRSGGMVANQANLLLTDSTANAQMTSNLLTMLWILLAVGLISGGFISFFTVRAISPPLIGMTSAMQSLADGDLETKVPSTERKDEIGEMAGAVQVFKDNAIHNKQLEAEQEELRRLRNAEKAKQAEQDEARAAERRLVADAFDKAMTAIASKNLGYMITEDFPESDQLLKDNFNNAISELASTVDQIGIAAAQILSGSGEIHDAANNLAKRTEQQAVAVEETAAALEETTTAVKTSSDSAKDAGTLVSTTKSNAEHSGKIVQNAIAAMGKIETSSEEIANIIGVIDDIAFQTNLLALNAGVEAARAGESGKGFAVVAQEVRELAQRSASAAKEIKQLITTSGEEVKNGAELVNETGRALEQIASEVAEINGHVSSIVSASNEQSVGLQEINQSVNNIDQGTQQNAAVAEQSTAASYTLSEEVSRINNMLQEFNTGNSNTGKPSANAQPEEADEQNKPQPSPARASTRKVARSFGGAGAAAAAVEDESWEEF